LLPSSASLVGIPLDVGYGKWCATSRFRFHILKTSHASLLAQRLLPFKPPVVLSKCCHLALNFSASAQKPYIRLHTLTCLLWSEMENIQEMALPIDLWCNTGQCDLETSWNPGPGDSRQFDSALSTPWNFEIDSQADTFQHFWQPNSSRQGSDNPLSTSRSAQAIEPADVRNYCISGTALIPTTTQSLTFHSRTSLTKLLKEIVLARAKADPRKISRQEMQRDAFIATRVEQLGDERAEEAGVASPISSSTTWVGKLQRLVHPQPGRFKSRSDIAQIDAPLINRCATDVEVTNVCGSTQPSFSLFPSPVSKSGTESACGRILANRPAGDIIQKQGKTSSAMVPPANSTFVEMTFNANMHPTSQQPKRARSKEDNAARLAVRRHGGACLKHKSTKKKVRSLCKL
jgi:hypothetical protein